MKNLKSNSFLQFIIVLLVIGIVSIFWSGGGALTSDANRVVIDFSSFPGPDGALGTADDLPVELGQSLTEEYSSLGLHFNGLNFIDFCCGFDFTLGVLVISGPFSVKFDLLQNEIFFDAKGIIRAFGDTLPIALRDVNGDIIASLDLTNADALPPSTNSILSGHFKISSAVPFSQVDFAATLPNNGGFFFDNLDFERLLPKTLINVNLDVKPGSYPNSVNPKNMGVIPVAILTTPQFDAASLDIQTIAFGPNKTSAVRFAIKQYSLEDIDADSDLDLVMHFETEKIGISCKDDTLYVLGKTKNDEPIIGSDSIKTTGCLLK